MGGAPVERGRCAHAGMPAEKRSGVFRLERPVDVVAHVEYPAGIVRPRQHPDPVLAGGAVQAIDECEHERLQPEDSRPRAMLRPLDGLGGVTLAEVGEEAEAAHGQRPLAHDRGPSIAIAARPPGRRDVEIIGRFPALDIPPRRAPGRSLRRSSGTRRRRVQLCDSSRGTSRDVAPATQPSTIPVYVNAASRSSRSSVTILPSCSAGDARIPICCSTWRAAGLQAEPAPHRGPAGWRAPSTTPPRAAARRGSVAVARTARDHSALAARRSPDRGSRASPERAGERLTSNHAPGHAEHVSQMPRPRR